MPTALSVPRVSVLMPSFNQAAFVRRALESLFAQTLTDWELIIVDDGSTDQTALLLQPLLSDPRIRLQQLPHNQGLGAALNLALAAARAPQIAYLPCDDLYYPEHLASLLAALEQHPEAVMAIAGVRHHYNKFAAQLIDGEPAQLVQVMHRKIAQRWVERAELVTDHLGWMYWDRLRAHGSVIFSKQISCEWVDHPQQRHKLIREPLGGINPYRVRYALNQPLRFRSSIGNLIDETSLYQHYRQRPDTPAAADRLKILLVGELAYNADRVLALEEAGHKLYGLWTPDPYWFNTVGPLPFGHVEDLPRHNWQQALRRIQPDIIYALLNWQSVPFVHHVLTHNPGVPFVWHFKEGPFICLEKGLWRELIDLYTRADAVIYSSPELRDWFFTVVPELVNQPALVLDGDLPKRDWFDAQPAQRRSAQDAAIHTVVPGRPIGLHPWTIGELAQQGIHLHFYGDFTQGVWKSWIEKASAVAQGHLHLHGNVDQDRWVAEFSQYDAGWLHVFPSANAGDLRRASWDDLNYPARISTLLAAGLPLIQFDNANAIVAAQSLAHQLDIGLFFREMPRLREQLLDQTLMARLRANAWRVREQFSFDWHVPRLLSFFHDVIKQTKARDL